VAVAADHRAQVDELLAGYRRSREQLGAVQRDLAAVQESVTSDDGLVTATVSAQGRLTKLTIAEAAYSELRPAALAATIVAVSTAAAAAVTRRSGAVLAPVLPPGTDPEALLRGTADLSAEELKPVAPAAVDQDENFETHTYLEAGRRRK
jgi:DNA-binding protein YbaB